MDGGGPIVKYLPAIFKERSIFMTDKFKEKHQVAAEIIQASCAAAGSKWRMLPNLEDRIVWLLLFCLWGGGCHL